MPLGIGRYMIMINVGDKIKFIDNSIVEVVEFVRTVAARRKNGDNKVFIYKASRNGETFYATDDGLESRYTKRKQ